MVKHENSLYSFNQQARGRVTTNPQDILRDIYENQIKPGFGFFEKLQRDLAALKGK